MKDCTGCIYESLKNQGWCSTQPHPCTNCSRITYDPVDKYQPKPAEKPKIEELDTKGLDRNFAKIERMADKINTLISAVNGLYERRH